MDKISIVNRGMTSEEIKKMNLGFDELSLEEGLEIEKVLKDSVFVALKWKAFYWVFIRVGV